jgi:hypothetical protein
MFSFRASSRIFSASRPFPEATIFGAVSLALSYLKATAFLLFELDFSFMLSPTL